MKENSMPRLVGRNKVKKNQDCRSILPYVLLI